MRYEGDLRDFGTSLGGRMILPDDECYDATRKVWNLSIDRRPAVIVQCKGVADVIRAVRFARQHDLRIAVRGGGHNVAGNAVCDDGLVVDLRNMNAVSVDPARLVVRAEGGCTIRDVDRETQMFGLAVPLGVVSETGIGGLTLSGGHSWLTRLHGFACDNLLSVDLVTADGELITAYLDSYPELFWALKGGGGNFGIAVSFAFRAHEIGRTVTLCAPFYPIEESARVLSAWRDRVETAPEAFTASCFFWTVPAHESFPAEVHGREIVVPAGVYTGPEDEAMRFIQPLRELAVPLLDLTGPIPYEALQQAFDPHFSSASSRHNYWKSLYLDGLSDDAVARIAAWAMNRPSPETFVPVRQMGGAGARLPEGGSALGGRGASFMLSIDTSWTAPGEGDAASTWTRDFWSEMAEGQDGAAYLNFLAAEEDHEALMRTSFGASAYDRLRRVKRQYDPDNVFSLNQNIPPW
jgi:FAD/FMN-containing dehydrogenase